MYDRLFLRENTYVPIAHFKWVRVQSQFNNIRSHFNVPIFIEVTSEGLIAVRFFFFFYTHTHVLKWQLVKLLNLNYILHLNNNTCVTIKYYKLKKTFIQ